MEAALADAGFDIAHRFAIDAVASDPGLELLAGAPVGILIGNTRALWPKFLAALPGLDRTHPLDDYTERTIAALLPDGARCYFAHRRYAGAFVPFQRLAVAAGLGSRSPTHLVIHPTYGPWFALRAVVACSGPPPATAPIPPVCQCDASCQAAMTRALASSGTESWRDWLGVRDSCTVGKSWRYDDDQIRYHYLKRFSR
jgi:hypothetical protein